MGVFSRRKDSGEATEPVEVEEDKPVHWTVQIVGPQGVVETLSLVEEGGDEIYYDETSVRGFTADGKEIIVTGLGGSFIAIIKEE